MVMSPKIIIDETGKKNIIYTEGLMTTHQNDMFVYYRLKNAEITFRMAAK